MVKDVIDSKNEKFYGKESSNPSENLYDYEKRFLRSLVMRGIDNIVMRWLETISRFAQYKMRELAGRGIEVNYDVGIQRDRVGGREAWRLVVEVTVPEWFIEDIIERKKYFVKMLRKMEYNIRRAERTMYQWPQAELQATAEHVANMMIQEAEREEEKEELEKEETSKTQSDVEVEVEIEGLEEVE